MRTLLTFSCFLFHSIMGTAQSPITIQYANARFNASVYISGLYQGNITAPATGNGIVWDYMTLLQTNPMNDVTFQFIWDGTQDVLMRDSIQGHFGDFSYVMEPAYIQSTDGRYLYAYRIPASAKPAVNFTGGTSDSILIPAQYVLLSEALPEMLYPTTTGTYWSSSFTYSLWMKAQMPSITSDSVHLEQRVYISRTDSIAGSGRILLQEGQKDVLLRRVTEWRTDSFYVNGYPANPAIFAMFGITQGQQTITYRSEFMDTASILPFFTIYHPTSEFGAAIQGIRSNEILVGIQEYYTIEALAVYPNPTTEYLTLSNPEHSMIRIYDSHSRLLKVCIPTDISTCYVADLPAGLYFVQCGKRVTRFLKQ